MSPLSFFRKICRETSAPWSDFSATNLYSAQLAEIPKGFFTSLKLINSTNSVRSVSLTGVSDQGEPLAAPTTLSLLPGGALERDIAQIFPTGAQLVGSLRVAADGPGNVGDVIFGDPIALQYAASLSLQPQTFTEAVFSQVANGAGYYTGLALFNPGSGATVTRNGQGGSDVPAWRDVLGVLGAGFIARIATGDYMIRGEWTRTRLGKAAGLANGDVPRNPGLGNVPT